MVDGIANGLYPGLFLVLAATPDVLDGPRGIATLRPLAERLSGNQLDLYGPRLHLPALDRERLLQLLERVRAVYQVAHPGEARDANLPAFLADTWTRALGGRVEKLPRLVIKKYLDVLGILRSVPGYDPYKQYKANRADPDVRPEERDDQAAFVEAF